ncbi:sigma-54-dependent Fis family transcriptional regulator [Pelotomaculum propionicicum]|uniref:DNA-binding transcriptional activator HyfR n=1 Tax=Pelotomaculum propionicicum TaxID=258475 RepID=A0A4Y7RVS5_9FIRM|nr:sigma 54-interacting transcriptional regulator [Pelotomaculum propionicicum]NLI11691.1 sigma 54-interacting transcriptional regulator [Peptococcaceae bacterium]TEB12782.1 DNA-binding transcriptional activator HyfR [Pelotomaculum propionicicum]
MSRLAQVSENGQKIAEAIATVLKVEVELIDTELVRVAGTGIVRNDVGSRLLRGLVNKHVLQTGSHIFISEAGFHPICLSCPLTGRCFYRASIVYPITANSEVIGTVSLIAFNDEQKETLSKNTESLIEFIGRMADLISSKALEGEIMAERMVMVNRLEAVIDAVYEGVVAVNHEGLITHFNQSAARLFGAKKENLIGTDSKQILPSLTEVLHDGKGFNSREVFINYEGRKLHLLSTARPIKADDINIAGVVATFRDFKETQRLAYEIMSNQEMIDFEDLVGTSKSFAEVKAKALKISGGSSTILIMGESGTGKEVFARAIHAASSFAHKPFVSINCGAIPENLLETELFGYDEGAFPGARRGGKQGKFELANGGTIFLDEVGSLSLYLQAKLLRYLQDRRIERVGGTRMIPVDVRVIVASNSDLQEMVRKNLFQDELYYRLSVIPLIIPPLRERPEDIPLLLEFYMKRFCKLLNKDIQGFDSEALKACVKYYWPGNVRELVYAVEYAINLEENSMISLESLPPELREETKKRTRDGIAGDGRLLQLAQLEKEAIAAALDRYGWTDEGKIKAARALGISRATIYRKIQRYGLKPA